MITRLISLYIQIN